MIHALCLNPAVDKLYAIDGFTPGETYSALTPERFAGGKGVNLARVLSQLGADVCLYAFLGETGGELIRREMEARCACEFIPVPGACRVTVNVVDARAGAETVLTERGPEIGEAHVASLLSLLRSRVCPGDIVCCSGSLPGGAPGDLYARIARLCASLGADCALDCSAALLGPSLQGARYALGKPNAAELCDHLRVPRAHDPRDIAELAGRLFPPFSALLVSLGASGGVFARPDRPALYARVPRLSGASSVGSGDASFAGLVYARELGLNARQTLRLAMACGAANAAEGPPGSVRPETVAALYEKIEAEEIT